LIRGEIKAIGRLTGRETQDRWILVHKTDNPKIGMGNKTGEEYGAKRKTKTSIKKYNKKTQNSVRWAGMCMHGQDFQRSETLKEITALLNFF
jgi:hypothetical protein